VIALLFFALLLNGVPVDFDDDPNIDFIWTPAAGTWNHYHVYVSENDAAYALAGETSVERFTVKAINGNYYRVKVCAVVDDGREGPFSPESDYVICTMPKLLPLIHLD
jgi:hypothetical protein